MALWQILVGAFLLDLLLGDPRWLPHPIRWMGLWIEKWEPRFRRLPVTLTFSGCLFALVLVTGTWIMTWTLLELVHAVYPTLAVILKVVIIYFALSVRSLRSSVIEIYKALKQDDLGEAKKRLAMVVGRDVRPLDTQGVMRASVETVGENLVDGVISPMFFTAIGGAPMAMAYKMINTLDSMIGYKNERYARFGKCAARIDDLANYIPARLSIPVISAAAFILNRRMGEAYKTAKREGRNHLSPNAGIPEAAFAGALGVRLGGPNIYGGKLVEKPYIGSEYGEMALEDVRNACRLMVLSSITCMIVCSALSALTQYLVYS
jgi:adenosylcobinamide-phosphate synthase